ncbi:Ig-like domain-containing domain [Larkinella soli]|uniref:Ig-like domain-containing domain n=1 Tax=Larkinella soli TaxID=1770527 RepID=UPI000FFB1946|nr:Ig-like domain-containing domain [Larkinella soli]
MKQALLLFALILVFLNSCSQYAAPIGGKKDTLAPVLVKSMPVNKQKNFDGRTLDLTFNEYIRVENPNQKILITPEPEAPFKYRARPNSLRLIFDKPFKENTTYTFNFSDAVKDVTENNPTTDLKLVFSTGSTIDSLRVGGKVTDIQTGQPVLNTLVGLYIPTDTLTPTKIKPYYFTRTDSSGNFLIENVKDGRYKIYAFDDKNLNLTLNPATEKVAFLKQDVLLAANIDTLKLTLFPYYNTPPRSVRTEQRVTTYTYIFDRGIESFTVKFSNPQDSIPAYFRTPTELTFFNGKASTDTIRVQLTVTDSLKNTSELSQRFRFRTPTRRENPDPVTFTARPANSEDVDRNLRVELKFNKPIRGITADSIQIISDSTTRQIVTAQDYKWDENQTRFILTKATNTRSRVEIRLGKGAFISVLNDSTAAGILSYNLRDPERYGTLSGRINTSARQLIIELLDDEFKVIDRQLNNPSYRFTMIKPGKYRIRVIIDENGNGRWDSGNLTEGRLPEPIFFHNTRPVSIKANFDISDINVDAL